MRNLKYWLVVVDCEKTPENRSTPFEEQSWEPEDESSKKPKKKKVNLQKKEKVSVVDEKRTKQVNNQQKSKTRSEKLKRLPFGGKSPRSLFKKKKNSSKLGWLESITNFVHLYFCRSSRRSKNKCWIVYSWQKKWNGSLWW